MDTISPSKLGHHMCPGTYLQFLAWLGENDYNFTNNLKIFKNSTDKYCQAYRDKFTVIWLSLCVVMAKWWNAEPTRHLSRIWLRERSKFLIFKDEKVTQIAITLAKKRVIPYALDRILVREHLRVSLGCCPYSSSDYYWSYGGISLKKN